MVKFIGFERSKKRSVFLCPDCKSMFRLRSELKKHKMVHDKKLHEELKVV